MNRWKYDNRYGVNYYILAHFHKQLRTSFRLLIN